MKEQNITSWIGDDLAVDVYFDYTAGEPPVYYPNDKAHPGFGPEIIINRIIVNNSDILDCLTQKVIDKIEDEIDEYMSQSD